MNDVAPIRPSWWYCLLGLPLCLAGFGGFGYILFHNIMHITDSLVQVVAPGHADLWLKQNTTYTVFLERQSLVNGKIYSVDESISGLMCVASSPTGDVHIPLSRPSFFTSYDVNGRSGRSILQFQTVQSGSYRFSCEYAEGSNGPEVVLAVGAGVGQAMLSTAIKSLSFLAGGMGLAGIVFVVVFFTREASKRRVSRVSQLSV